MILCQKEPIYLQKKKQEFWLEKLQCGQNLLRRKHLIQEFGQEQQQLQAGSDSFLALWKPANSAEPEGVVIIVPGAGENADWPQAIGPLRRKLPDADWGSLSLSLPDVSVDTLPPRVMEAPKATVDTSSKEASTADKPIEQAASAEAEGTDPAVVPGADEQDKTDASRIFARIDAAVAFAQTQSARSVVLLGHGTGAWWAARYLSEKQPSQVQKFVMVAAQTPSGRHPDVQQLAPGLKLPTADVFYQDTDPSRKNALARAQAALDSGAALAKLNELVAYTARLTA